MATLILLLTLFGPAQKVGIDQSAPTVSDSSFPIRLSNVSGNRAQVLVRFNFQNLPKSAIVSQVKVIHNGTNLPTFTVHPLNVSFFTTDTWNVAGLQSNNGISSNERGAAFGQSGGASGNFVLNSSDVQDIVKGAPNNGWVLNATQASNGQLVNVQADVTWSHAKVGDSNLDGEFNSTDLVHVFIDGKYETGEAAHWQEGDWNGDGVFDSSDIVTAFQAGTYEQGNAALEADLEEYQ